MYSSRYGSLIGFAIPVLLIAVFAGCQQTDNAGDELPEQQRATEVSLVATSPEVPFEAVKPYKLSAVDRAYRVIRKPRSQFDPTNPSVRPSHREYVTEVLALIDQAVLWRVSGMQAIARGHNNPEKWVQGADNLIDNLRDLRVPQEMEDHQDALQQSLLAYRSFFKRWQGQQLKITSEFVTGDFDLRNASGHARDAYHLLLISNETADGQAQHDFYNSHMALDPL